MRFIDINTMIGPYPFGEQNFTDAEGLLREMDRLGIERALPYHTLAQSHDPPVGNTALVKEIAPHPRLLGTMVLTPLIELEFGGHGALDEFIRDHRIAAIRLYPGVHNYLLEIWNLEDILSTAERNRLPIMFDMRHLEMPLGAQYEKLYTLAKAYPQLSFLLLTVGYGYSRILMKLLDKCPNIAIDTSTFINFRGIEDVVRCFGAERVFFGSRMPRIEAGVSVGRVLYADISESDKRKIAYENADVLLRASGLSCERGS